MLLISTLDDNKKLGDSSDLERYDTEELDTVS